MIYDVSKPKNKVSVTIRVDPDDLKRFDELIKGQQLSRSEVLQSYISGYIDHFDKEDN